MRLQDKKASITKAIRKYVFIGNLVLKLNIESEKWGIKYFVTITPNSNKLILSIPYSKYGGYLDRVSIPNFSDYVVRMDTFDLFMEKFSAAINKKKGI